MWTPQQLKRYLALSSARRREIYDRSCQRDSEAISAGDLGQMTPEQVEAQKNEFRQIQWWNKQEENQ